MHQMYVLIQNLAHEASSLCGRFSSGAYEGMGSKGWWGVGSAKSGGNNARSIGLKADCLGAAVHDGAWSMDGKSWPRDLLHNSQLSGRRVERAREFCGTHEQERS